MSEQHQQRILASFKVPLFGTLYYIAIASVYVALVRRIPESFLLAVDASTPPTAPEIAVPALVLFGVSMLVAIGVYGEEVREQ